MSFLFNASSKYIHSGILFLRVGIGFAFMYFHGWKKIAGGPEVWEKYGNNMRYLGIDFAPEVWGFMAGAAEFFGGFLLLMGLLTRPAALFIAFTMAVAIIKKVNEEQAINYPLEMLIVVCAIFIMGPGKYSLDQRIR